MIRFCGKRKLIVLTPKRSDYKSKMKVEIFIHKNCVDCEMLLEFLQQKNLIDKVTIIDTEKYPFLALEKGVISTPSVFVDDKLLYAGIVDFDELERILVEGKFKDQNESENIKELAEKIMAGVVDSFAATSWLYVNKDFKGILEQKDFIFAVTGLAKYNDPNRVNEIYEKIREELISHAEDYFNAWKNKMIRNISYNFIRELYFLYEKKVEKEIIKQRYPIEVFAHWLMVRGGTTGRVGLKIHPLSNTDVINRIAEAYQYVFENYDEIWNYIIKEQKEISEKILNSKLFANL